MRGKSNICFALISALVLCAGCASSSFSVGRPFDETGVTKIVKGKTTAAELLALFGEPFTKAVVSENEVKWNYYHTAGVVSAVATPFGATTETDSQSKILDVLLKNDTVVNFTFTKGPFGFEINSPGVKSKPKNTP